jgi:hypothetical protein
MAKKDCCEIGVSIFGWIIQIILLVSSVLFITITVLGYIDESNLIIIALPLCLYTAYILFEILFSNTLEYITNIHKADSIHTYMSNLFNSPVTRSFSVACYHYINQTVKYKDKDGNMITKVEKKKEVTFRGSDEFKYYSWRDISGIFLLDYREIKSKKSNHKIAFIKLDLDLDIIYPDETELDYKIQRDNFYASNRRRDSHMYTSEDTSLNGFKKYNMVKISEQSPPFVSCFWYVFFTFILPLGRFYSIYMKCFCEEQVFTIRKVISTRTNLNKEDKYSAMQPKLIIYGEEVLYGSEYDLIRSVPYLPSKEDIQTYENESRLKIRDQDAILSCEVEDDYHTEELLEINYQSNFNNPMDCGHMNDANNKLV